LLLERLYHEGLAQASYLVGCQETREAIVVDPNRNVEQYVTLAERRGFRITHVTETHIHADYLSGSRDLAARTGARLFLSGEGGPDWLYAFATESEATLLRDGDRIMIGNVRLDVVHTPGHTPEHLTFVLTDTKASERPMGAFTGDFIFVGDVGRPDLLERAANVQGTMRAGASQLFASLRRFVAAYPDHLQLWPGHGAGSACGKALGAVPQTTLGYEKLVGWAFQIPTEEEFIEAVLEGQPDPPRYFAMMKRLNRDGPPPLADSPEPPRQAAARLDAVLAAGGVVVDIRPAADFAAGYVPGSISIPLNRSFVGRAGWLLGYDRDVHLLSDAEDDGAARAAAFELAMIGLDRVAGWFGADALAAWRERGALEVVPQVSPREVAEGGVGSGWTVIDVRAADEWEAGHIPGAQHAPLGRLLDRLDTLTLEGRVAVQCQTGSRSAVAASLLRARGIEAANLAGGLEAWRREGLPETRDDAPVGAR
jgi:hydroxyacylglutathione hydrolase